MKQEKLMNFIEAELISKYTSETVMSYLYAIKRFLNIYPNAQRLTLTNIEGYFADLKKQRKAGVNETLSSEYRKVILASIKALYDCYLELGMVKEHPCRTYHIDEKKPRGKDFSGFLSLDEMGTLLNLKEERFRFVGNRNKAMVGLLIYQGMTSKELVELKVNAMDLDAGTVKIIGQGKNRSRTLELKPSQIAILIRYIEEDRTHLLKTNKTNKLFLGLRGTPMTVDGLHEFIHRLGCGAFGDKEVSPANIRNSVISYWLNVRKIPLEFVQVMAGHCYPSTTEAYIKPDEQEQREAINKLHEAIFG
jgi:integrase/recombinase XerD